jgi:hypothetical protein
MMTLKHTISEHDFSEGNRELFKHNSKILRVIVAPLQPHLNL